MRPVRLLALAGVLALASCTGSPDRTDDPATVTLGPTETRDTRPAAWFSPDRTTWTSVAVDATTYWGRRAAILNSVACSRDRIAVVGARSGGAHGNPRVTTFRLDRDRLVDVPAVFIQYGGVTATNVGPIAGGPTGWLITGNRTSGPGGVVHRRPEGVHPRRGEAGPHRRRRPGVARAGRRLGRRRMGPRRRGRAQRATPRAGPARLDLARRPDVDA